MNESTQLIKPGQRILISVQFLDSEEFGEEEACHPDIVIEDFLQTANDPMWKVEFEGVKQ